MESKYIQKLTELQGALIELLVQKGVINRQELAETIERAFPGDANTEEDAAYRQSALFALLEKNRIITKDELLRAHEERQISD